MFHNNKRFIYVDEFSRIEELFKRYQKISELTHQTWCALFNTEGHRRRLLHKERLAAQLRFEVERTIPDMAEWKITHDRRNRAMILYTIIEA